MVSHQTDYTCNGFLCWQIDELACKQGLYLNDHSDATYLNDTLEIHGVLQS